MVSPKYARVQSGIVNLIATKNIKIGEMLPNETQLAECFDVSIVTIRRAVKHLEENRIVRREQGRGTFVIADIQGREDNGSIVYLDITREKLTFAAFSLSVKTMDTELIRHGYSLNFMLAGQEPDSEVISGLKNVRGVIATGWINAKWVQILNALDMPVVFLGGITCDPLDVPMVSFDYRKMAEILAQQLYEKGAKRIGLILGGSDYAPSALMKAGLLSVLKRRGEELEPALVYYSDDNTPGAVSRNIGKFLADNPDVDGFIVERGSYVHVLNNLSDDDRHPFLGVMTTQPEFGNARRNTYEAAFKDDIYRKAVEHLLALILSGKKSIENIKLEPYLVEK